MRQRAELAVAAPRDDRQPTCGDLQDVSSDFHALIQAACPLCRGSGPECLVGKMRGVLAEALAEDRPVNAVRNWN